MAWLPGYSKYKKITLTGGASGAMVDFQIKLTVDYDSDMQSDFSDLRFTKADGTTLIDAWLESKTDGVSAEVWVEFPTTPANGVEETYYMYYGNGGAVSDWDGTETFLFFDDFEDGTSAAFEKYSGNPIVGILDTDERLAPSVIYNDSEYKMYYGVKGETPDYVIWMSTSSDGKNFSYYGSNPILDQGSAGSWDDSWIGQPFVFYHNGEYWMFYCGHGGDQKVRIGLAKSTDGVNFTKITNGIGGTSKVFELGGSGDWDEFGVKAPEVLFYDGKFWMFYGGQNTAVNEDIRLGLATSTDGTNFTRITDGPWGTSEVLRPGATGEWDENNIYNGFAFPYGGEWKMYYYGKRYGGTVQGRNAIGFATSSDLKNWTKYSGNPILKCDVDSPWENRYVTMPFFRFTPEQEVSGIYGQLYYGACGSTDNCYNTIGVADQITEGDFVHFYEWGFPKWTIDSGTWSAAAHKLQHTSGSGNYGDIASPSTAAYGAWKWKIQLGVASVDNYIQINFISSSATDENADNYHVLIRGEGLLRLRKRFSGATTDLLDPGWTADAAEHTIEVIRKSNNEFELFLDDVSKGTHTDSDITTSSHFLLFEKSNNDFDDVFARKYAANPATYVFGAEQDAGAIMNQFQKANMGAYLYNGALQ